MKRPEKGFTLELTEGTLRIPGQDRPTQVRPYIELRVSGIHSRAIEIHMKTAQELTQTAIDHGGDPLQDYSPEIRKAAYAWAGRDDQLQD